MEQNIHKIKFITFRNKIIFLIAVIILGLQIVATLIQYNQASLLLLGNMTEKASASSSEFVIQLNKALVALNTAEAKMSFIDVFVNLEGKTIFDKALNTDAELTKIRFVDSAGKIILSESRTPEISESLQGSVAPSIKKLISENKIATLQENGDFIVFNPVKIDDTYAGYLISYYSNKVYLAQQSKLALTNIAYLIIFLAVGILAAYFVSRGIIRPVVQLKEFVDKIGKGNLDVRMAPLGGDEFSDLAVAFNQMAQKIKEANLDLEKKVLEMSVQKQDLENVKIATQNILEDLSIERESLRQANAKDEALLNSIGEGMVAVDSNQKIIRANPAAEKILGWSVNQLVGKYLKDAWKVLDEKGEAMPESDRPISAALTGKLFKSDPLTSPYFYSRKDGVNIPVAITVAPVMVNDKIIGAINIFHDITKEKEIERLRMDFLTLASHQLRTPLSGTKWLIETMQRKVVGTINKKQKEYLNQIYQLNERMIQLVTEMLDVLRLESKTELAERKPVLVSDIYKDVPILMRVAAESREIVLENKLKNYKTVTAYTNLEVFKNIIECFISNAINYSNSGEKIILDMKEEPGALVFFVKDNGIGIPKKEQEKMFERFYRASNAKNLKPDGTGLGLSLAKMLSEKIGAELSFTSQEDKGSTFYLKIPSVQSPEEGL